MGVSNTGAVIDPASAALAGALADGDARGGPATSFVPSDAGRPHSFALVAHHGHA